MPYQYFTTENHSKVISKNFSYPKKTCLNLKYEKRNEINEEKFKRCFCVESRELSRRFFFSLVLV
jgi:hypothetical protein